MRIESIEYTLTVADMTRAVRFWRELLALKTLEASARRTELGLDRALLSLNAMAGGDEPSSTNLVLRVDDLDAACRRVVHLGGEVRGGPSSRSDAPRRLAWVADADGNRFLLTEEVDEG